MACVRPETASFLLSATGFISGAACAELILARRAFTHAGIAAGMGKAFSRVCLFVRALGLTGKRLMGYQHHVYYIAVDRHALTQRSKGQGHTVKKTVTVARLLLASDHVP